MAWVPYVPDIHKWTNHFKRMAEGKIHPNRNGVYLVGDQGGGIPTPDIKINYVTPTAAAVDRAKSQLLNETNGTRKYHKRPQAIRKSTKTSRKVRQTALTKVKRVQAIRKSTKTSRKVRRPSSTKVKRVHKKTPRGRPKTPRDRFSDGVSTSFRP